MYIKKKNILSCCNKVIWELQANNFLSPLSSMAAFFGKTSSPGVPERLPGYIVISSLGIGSLITSMKDTEGKNNS